MSNPPYVILPDLYNDLPDIPKDGILSRTVFKAGGFRVVLFAFDQGQELTEHTSAFPAILQFIRGEATVTLGSDVMQAQANTWVYMEPNLPHSILAKTPLIMLLLLNGSA